MAPTPENPESWHNQQRPREIYCVRAAHGVCNTLSITCVHKPLYHSHTTHTPLCKV